MKTRVGILIGGPSSEHEVSLNTGEMVAKYLDGKKFEPCKIKIEKDGSWPISMENLKKEIDVAFIAMHGEYGEDGKVQSLLETFGIPYTGSDPVASALAMDKQRTAALLSANNFYTPKSLIISKADSYGLWAISKNFRFPLVIKPNDQGSSLGTTLVYKRSELKPALEKAFRHSNAALAQKYIQGREITCGVLEINGVPIALLPTEILPKANEFFDFHAKYNAAGATEITPPNLPGKLIRKIQQTALAAHKLLECRGMSRTDMILQKDGNLCILEVNTIPGMTKTSLLPQQAIKTGISFPKLLEIIINSGLSR